MKFLYNFAIFIIFFAEFQLVWIVSSEKNFDDMELTRIANKLNPIECLRLLEAMHLKKPLTDEEYLQAEVKLSLEDESILRRQLDMPFFNRENCRDKLEEWSHNLPHGSSKWARIAMEAQLRILGRPDLAKYVRRNRRVVRYFNELSRISKNIPIRPTRPPQIITKSNNLPPSNGMIKHLTKEVLAHPNFEVPQPAVENSPIRETAAVQVASNKSAGVDTTTKWTAFLTLLGVILLTILSTVFFAVYKKNRGALCTRSEKCREDRCRLADDYPRKSWNRQTDIERGEVIGNSCIGRRRDRRSFSREPSRSPSSCCVREEMSSGRKSKAKKLKRSQREETMVEKVPKFGCSKKCIGIKDRIVKVDKSTKTKEPKLSEKSNQVGDARKPRSEFKKFHERLANILRKDNPACKCCKCSVFPADDKTNDTKLKNGKNKNICMDEKCQKTKLRNIAELCLSLDETSPTGERNEYRIKDKQKKKKKKKKRRKKVTKEKEGYKSEGKEKESGKTSPENSARSKDRRESRMKKKIGKAKKEKYNVEEACTRKTCGLGRTNIEEISNCG